MRCFERFSASVARLISNRHPGIFSSRAGPALEKVGNDIEEHVDPTAGKQKRCKT